MDKLEAFRYFGWNQESIDLNYKIFGNDDEHDLPVYHVMYRIGAIFFQSDEEPHPFEYPKSGKYYIHELEALSEYTKNISFKTFIEEMGFTEEFASKYICTDPELYLPTLLWEIEDLASDIYTLRKPQLNHRDVNNHRLYIPCSDLKSWVRWNFGWLNQCSSYLTDPLSIKNILWSSEDYDDIKIT